MCRSVNEGGQRCAAHTRPRFNAATFGTPEWDEAAVDYASTPEGLTNLTATADSAEREGNYQVAAQVRSALLRGQGIREANREAGSLIRGDNDTTRRALPDGFLPNEDNQLSSEELATTFQKVRLADLEAAVWMDKYTTTLMCREALEADPNLATFSFEVNRCDDEFVSENVTVTTINGKPASSETIENLDSIIARNLTDYTRMNVWADRRSEQYDIWATANRWR